MVTLKTIAEECGLSCAAVSKALHHLPGVSEEKAEMVRETARRLGYYPNAAARTLKTSKSLNIGVLFENGMAHEFFSTMLDEIRSSLEERGYDVTLMSNKYKYEGGFYGHVMRRQCDGVIIMQHVFDSDGVDQLLESPLPVVSIDRVFPNCTSVLSKNTEAMQDVMRYLHSMGHTRIAFIHGEMGDVTRQRIEGFERGYKECNLEVPDGYIVEAKYQNPQVSRLMTHALLLKSNRPTCIIYPDDFSYLGGLAELRTQSLSVPDDISCFGYDGIQLSSELCPALATYRQDAKKMGRVAVEELLGQIEGTAERDRTIRVSGCIQPGGTVKKLV